MPDFSDIHLLGLALAQGLLIGLERGWQAREAPDGTRIAGIRTFGLIGLLGGLIGLLGRNLGPATPALGLLGLAVILTVAHRMAYRKSADAGITGLIAALVTYALGLLAVSGAYYLSAASAVVVTLLLGLKPTLHHWIHELEGRTFYAALRLLLISVVILPILPNQGFGPWQALNPYALWWMVVLIAGLSFAGFIAMQLAGPRRGTLYTGLFGGLVSSTAVTLNLSRLSRGTPEQAGLYATGILIACGTMFPRTLIIAGAINPQLGLRLALPLGIMTVVTYLGAALLWHRTPAGAAHPPELQNPLELRQALRFAALLAAILLLAEAIKRTLGDAGLYLLAAVSGITDVDPINLSVARMTHGDLALSVAAIAIVVAAISNTLTKGVLAAAVGHRRLGLRVLGVLFASAALGVLSLAYTAS
ncbi:MAG: MgtC/SapB family protein [Acidihalobacter sp.]